MRVEGGGSSSRMRSGTTRLDFQAEGTTAEPQDEVKEREQMVMPPGQETLKAEFGRSSAPGADS